MEMFYEQIKGKEPVFVEFFANWCPHCQRMKPIIEELKKKRKGQVTVLNYDIDAVNSKKIAEYYQVQIVPTMMLFKDGEQIWRQSGEIEWGKLDQILKRNL